MRIANSFSIYLIILLIIIGCNHKQYDSRVSDTNKVRIILDTDANNEVDDQHAIAYLLMNGNYFDVEGITVNKTYNGGEVDQHLKEAERVIRLCNLYGKVKIYKGANGSFEDIRKNIQNKAFDGSEAVDFIIQQAKQKTDNELILLPIGKLTNIALALLKDPSIVSKVRIVWLGSNYPEPGEYNQDNDLSSLDYILSTKVKFEIALVRYGKPSGTDAVKAYLSDIEKIMPGKGPNILNPVNGRHGGAFTNFGDYSVSLFKNIETHGDPPSRSLFDMAAVAIVKNPLWATPTEIPGPKLVEGNWVDEPTNTRKIIIWENFDKENIMKDFYNCMENYILAQ